MLLATLGAGVLCIAAVIGFGVREPIVVIVVGCGLLVAFSALVLYEVGRLLADETGDAVVGLVDASTTLSAARTVVVIQYEPHRHTRGSVALPQVERSPARRS